MGKWGSGDRLLTVHYYATCSLHITYARSMCHIKLLAFILYNLMEVM